MHRIARTCLVAGLTGALSVSVAWAGGTAHVQPPASQGVLLAMALQRVQRLRADGVEVSDHVLVEATEAAFGHRSSAGRGASLLDEELSVNLERASRRGGVGGVERLRAQIGDG